MVGGNPIGVAVDTATHTVYVANNADNTVSVINAATCNARHTAGCGQHPATVKIGAAPIGDAVDQRTNTVYVVNTGDNTVSVIDGRTCNATVRSGCDTVQTIPVGSGPNVDAVDEKTDTIYVANFGSNTVSAIDGATCNSVVTSGCGNTPPVVHVGSGPQGLGVDAKTDTVYDTNGNGNLGSVSVIDGATCNATVTSGCGQTPATVKLPAPSDGAAVDAATHTAYVLTGHGSPLSSIAMIDTDTCDATHHAGCGHTPAFAQGGAGPIWIVPDLATKTMYIANQEDGDVSALSTATCNAHRQSGCTRPLPAIAAAPGAGAVDVDIPTDTLYYSSQDDNTVSVLNGATCNANHTHGCTKFAPTTTVGNLPTGVAVNQATGTLYVGNWADGDLSVINPRKCNAGHLRGCRRAWPTVKAGVTPEALAVNERTDTIYTANSDPDNGYLGDTVSVVDGAACNVRTTSGCRNAPGTIKVGNEPDTIAVNPHTDTVYVTNANDDTMSVINGATCNATIRSGCDQTPATITAPAGDFAGTVAVNPMTDTVYLTLESQSTGVGGVDVINGATCNGRVRTGCRPATVTMKLGSYAGKLAVDQRTDTVYVLNIGGNDVSVIDGATCNAHVTRGCHRAAPTMALDAFPTGIGLNPITGAVYVDSFGASDVWVFDGTRCNAKVTTGCGQQPKVVPTGDSTADIAVSQATNTAYVADQADGKVSLIRR